MERREHYRVSADRLDEPSVIVVPSTGTPVRGRLVDMSASGAGVLVHESEHAALSVGERVVLVVGAHQFERPITVSAVTRFQIDDDTDMRCGFQFLDPEDFIRHLPTSLTGLFDARDMIRVEPSKGAPVRVTIAIPSDEGDAEPAMADLGDISGVGVSLELEVADAARIADETHVAMLVHLPDTPHALSLMGQIRYRLPLGDRWRFGIEFEPSMTDNFEIQRQEIVSYVMVRQEEIEAEAAVER